MSKKRNPKKRRSALREVEQGYDLYAKQYDESQGYLDSFERYDLFEMLGEVKGLRVLDLGCGTGRMSEYLIKFGAEVVGLDISEEMLKIARKKLPKVEFVQGDSDKLPFEDDSFDMVVASFLVVHLPTMDATFDEAYRVLKPGGNFIVTNINQRKAPKLKIGKEEIVIKSHYHRPDEVIEALEKSFFEPMEERFVEESDTWINQIVKAKK